MSTISPSKRVRIYARDGYACVYCGKGGRLTLDHILPRCRGGSNKAQNLATCCFSCNQARGHLHLAYWLQKLHDAGIDTDATVRRLKNINGTRSPHSWLRDDPVPWPTQQPIQLDSRMQAVNLRLERRHLW